MNTKGKDGKKRIAHIGSSSSNIVENAEKHQHDYLASIMERMDSNDKQIVSYDQLNDYRKSKFKPVLPDVDISQPVESSGTFKLKKKPCPLMAKCQKNLKYIKHNRCIPKPRAHVGSLPKETPSVKLSSELKKNIDAQIKPKKVQKISSEPPSSEKLSRSLSLHTKAKRPVPSDVKPNEEWNDKILRSQNGTETKKRKISKQSESESRVSVETNSSYDHYSSDDNFETFIAQQVGPKHKSKKKRKKVQKRKVFKRIKTRNASSSESDSDNEEGSFSNAGLNKSTLEANKLKKSKNLDDVNYHSDNASRDNSHQFDFDNPCDDDDSSDNCVTNETFRKTPQVDNVLNFSSNLANKDNKTVEQSDDLSGCCLSLSNTADGSPQLSMSNKESNQSENSVPVDQVSSSKQVLSETKNDSEEVQAGGYESDDCVILEDSPPGFNIKISAVKSVAMLPSTDKESAVAVLESYNPQNTVSDKTSSGNESIASVSNIADPNKLSRDESDDCLILDDESSSDTSLKLNSRDSLKSCASKDTKQSVIPPLKVCHENVALDSDKEALIIEDSNQKESPLASSRYKPDALSDKNVWDVLKTIDFEKIKTLPNSLSKGKIKSEIESFSSLPQEKPFLAYPESYSKNSTISKNSGEVELIDLSDDEDASQNDKVESTNQNLDFISQTVPTDATIGSTSSIGQKDLTISSKYSNFEVKTGDVSSSGVLDENDLNFHKSLISNDITCNKFPLKQEANLSAVKKELQSTSDELDISSASSLQSLYSTYDSDVHKLLDLYHKEYQQYKEIEKTGINISDGLSLLLNRQVDKLMHIKSSIKNILKHDPCFLKASKNVKPELTPIKCDAIVKKEQDREEKAKPSPQLSENLQLLEMEHPELSIYTESVLQGIQKVVGNSLPPESSLRAEKVKEQLTNVKCAQCGRTASAACQGCFKVFYCSTECGMSDWEKGHSVSCGT